MHHLGLTRSIRCKNHALHTPDAFIRIQLPGMCKAAAVVHTSPAMGAAFTQYIAEFELGGSLGKCEHQRFIYVLEGSIRFSTTEGEQVLSPDQYAYLPSGHACNMEALQTSRAAVIEKSYRPLPSIAPPAALFADEVKIAGQPLMGDADVVVRSLLPDTMAFDFAVNTMTYQPGAALSVVEMHIMEHGLLMLAGGGIYRLDDEWYPVTAGDFIWMGPYCPQWFGALGKAPAKYLIYKDWNRHPLG